MVPDSLAIEPCFSGSDMQVKESVRWQMESKKRFPISSYLKFVISKFFTWIGGMKRSGTWAARYSLLLALVESLTVVLTPQK